MASIGFKNSHDIVLQTLIIQCLKMYKISDKIISYIMNVMKNKRVELTTAGQTLAEVKIQGGIFQRDSFSPLLFVITMMPFHNVIRKCTGRMQQTYKITRKA